MSKRKQELGDKVMANVGTEEEEGSDDEVRLNMFHSDHSWLTCSGL